MKNEIYTYHNETKHSPMRYARSLGYMDWANQPDPFRSYKGAEKIALPLSLENPTPPYHMIFSDELPSAPLLIQSVSQLLQFSLGLAAWKQAGDQKWALRCNASSGNLHPTEGYLVLPPLQGISDKVSIAHYAPKDHGLELLCEYENDFFDTLAEGSFLFALSSITWREVWKYGERAFRYCSLDAGHAFRAVQVSAMMLGWKVERLDKADDEVLARLLGLDQGERFVEGEKEFPDMLLLISPLRGQRCDPKTLLHDLPSHFQGRANRLSPTHQSWEMIERIEKASFSVPKQQKRVLQEAKGRLPSAESKEIVQKRRSAQMMNPEKTAISQNTFFALLDSVRGSLDGFENATNLVMFVHDVEGLDRGLYLLIRNREHLRDLKRLMSSRFMFEEVTEDLYLLDRGDFRTYAKSISCNQSIASDGAFSLGMLCEFSNQIEQFGEHRYKELYWECGAIGQQLYLEATALGISATGIGCYLDDTFHHLLGLEGNQFQSMYHFTVGRAIVDARLTTLPPY